MRPARRPQILALALAVAGAACAATHRTPFDAMEYPGALLPAQTMPDDVVWQQRVTATWGLAGGEPGERGFDAAIQKQGDALTVLGLSPMGSVGFAMILRGTTIEVQNHAEQEPPFPARFVLLDVQRTFYPWLGAPLANGQRTGVVGDEEITERWANGRLMHRTFTRRDGKPAGTIAVTYDWRDDDARDRLAPSRTVLDNGWFAYRLAVDTHRETKLPPPR
ncbi:MAG: DUF3261 domain-containing protein [Planctomycetes bacterium]|nr:DUF3261 domain-containing protein [Planctomycetota bacterium]